MIRNKRGDIIMKDYVMIVLFLALIMASVTFLISDMNLQNEGEISDNVDVEEIESLYDRSFVESMNETSHERLSELQDAGFIRTVFVTTLELVQTIPRLVVMTVSSTGNVVNLLFSGDGLIPQEIILIFSTILFVGLLWAVVYFIRRLSK